MADFQPILARAIAGLPDKSPDARRSVYDRARAALVAQLRSLDPPLSEAEIMRERLSLDEAVSRIEADFEDQAQAQTSLRAPVPTSPPRPVSPPVVPPAEADWPEPVREARREPTPSNEQDRFDDERPQQPPAYEAPGIRPRVNPPRERRVKPGHIRTAIVGTGIAIAVAAIAGAAYYVNKIRPPDTATRARIETPAQPAQTDGAAKLNDRVGEAANTPQRNAPSATTAPGSDIAVAQRAILYSEDPANPQQPRAIPGRVFWRLDSESAGQGRPVETIVRATIEVPDGGFGLDFTIRRNADSAFPASHIIGMRFTPTGTIADAIREVGVPQFKTDEGERGAPLSAISSALGENLFVAALSNVPVELDRNIELMQGRPWIDIPVRFASGRRGIITFEKGGPGAQTLADALGRWR